MKHITASMQLVLTHADRLIGTAEVEALRGFRRGRIYHEVREGLLTPPIKQGKRSSSWPLSEVVAINKARIAGYRDDELQALVVSLVTQRGEGAGSC